MGDTEKYVHILEESLQKKIQLLIEIEEKTLEQKEILEQEIVDIDAWECNIEEKGELLEELNLLDTGFQGIYDKIGTELIDHKQTYAASIQNLQSAIKIITEKAMSIQVKENQNKVLAEKQFAKLHQRTRYRKVASNAATKYYQTMSKLQNMEAQFMDRKK